MGERVGRDVRRYVWDLAQSTRGASALPLGSIANLESCGDGGEAIPSIVSTPNGNIRAVPSAAEARPAERHNEGHIHGAQYKKQNENLGYYT